MGLCALSLGLGNTKLYILCVTRLLLLQLKLSLRNIELYLLFQAGF